jgi:hypothetical protein
VVLELPWLDGRKPATPPAEERETAPEAESDETGSDVPAETPEGVLADAAPEPFAAAPQAVDSEGEFPILPGSEEREER